MVFSEGASASALGGRNVSNLIDPLALLLSGLLYDRFGIGNDAENVFTPYRIIGIICGYCHDFVVSPQWHSHSSSYLPFFRFFSWFVCSDGSPLEYRKKVAEATIHAVQSPRISSLDFVFRHSASYSCRIRHVTVQLPDVCGCILAARLD